MTLTLQSICTIKTALGIARLANPNDPRFTLAYQEFIKQWARDIDTETATLIDASREPMLLRRQV